MNAATTPDNTPYELFSQANRLGYEIESLAKAICEASVNSEPAGFSAYCLSQADVMTLAGLASKLAAQQQVIMDRLEADLLQVPAFAEVRDPQALA